LFLQGYGVVYTGHIISRLCMLFWEE